MPPQKRSPDFRLPSPHPSSRLRSTIKMWVLLEDKYDPVKFVLDDDDFKDYEEFTKADLDDFKRVLCKHYPELKNVKNENIKLFNESLEHLDPRTNLSSLD